MKAVFRGASFRNLDYAEKDIDFASDLDYNLKMMAFDAQTSGGLLISAPSEMVENILEDLRKAGLAESAVIGSAVEFERKFLYL